MPGTHNTSHTAPTLGFNRPICPYLPWLRPGPPIILRETLLKTGGRHSRDVIEVVSIVCAFLRLRVGREHLALHDCLQEFETTL